jgi:hypothetical protein
MDLALRGNFFKNVNTDIFSLMMGENWIGSEERYECTSVRNKTRMRTDWVIFCAPCFSLLACAAGTFSRYLLLLLQLICFISRYLRRVRERFSRPLDFLAPFFLKLWYWFSVCELKHVGPSLGGVQMISRTRLRIYFFHLITTTASSGEKFLYC